MRTAITTAAIVCAALAQPSAAFFVSNPRLARLSSRATQSAMAPKRPAPTMSDDYSMADQQARFAMHKETKNERVLNIDKFYDGSQFKGKRVLVTGANRGVGLALTKQLKADGAVVIAAVRKTSPELDDEANQVIEGIDVMDDDLGGKLVAGLGAEPVDVVINNAGYFWEPEETLENLNFREELKMIDICAVGPLRVSGALVNAGLLKEGSKIVMISSQGGSITWRDTQNPTGHDYGHHMSKAAENMMSKLLARELAPKSIAVLILHPGFNRSDMTRKYEAIWDIEGAVETEVGAKRVLHEINIGSMETTGKFINCEDGLQIPW